MNYMTFVVGFACRKLFEFTDVDSLHRFAVDSLHLIITWLLCNGCLTPAVPFVLLRDKDSLDFP